MNIFMHVSGGPEFSFLLSRFTPNISRIRGIIFSRGYPRHLGLRDNLEKERERISNTLISPFVVTLLILLAPLMWSSSVGGEGGRSSRGHVGVGVSGVS